MNGVARRRRVRILSCLVPTMALMVALPLGAPLALVLAQIDPQVRDSVAPAIVEIAIMLDVTENGSTESIYQPTGSGTIISPDGLILTNWHVVDMAAHRADLDAWEAQAENDGESLTYVLDEERVLILTTDGTSEPEPAYTAEVVAEHHALDLAVLRITGDAYGTPLSDTPVLPFVSLGDSSTVRQGDPIDVFGYPMIGGESLTYSDGVVSGFSYEEGIDGPAWINSNAMMSGGSSGGAALDRAGRLIGVPTRGTELDCRPGDTNRDGTIDVEDVGCIPTGGSIGQLRPINLAKPMLEHAGRSSSEAKAQPAATATSTPRPTNTAVPPTSTPEPTNTPAPPITTPGPTNTPQPIPTPEPMLTPRPLETAADDLELLELLPTQDQVPAGLSLVNEAERSKAEIIQSLGGTDEVVQLLDDWGWSGNAYRDFVADDTAIPPGGTNFLNVSVHRFADAESAANALTVYSEQIVFAQGLPEVESPAIGESARLLVGESNDLTLSVLYAQQGPILYRLGGSAPIGSGDPTIDVLAVAAEIIPSSAAAVTTGTNRPEPTDVPMFRGDAARTGEVPGPDPQGQLGELWRVETGQEIWSSPAVVDDVVYVGVGGFSDSEGALIALEAKTGKELWRHKWSAIVSSPAVSDGRVYVTNLVGYLMILDASDGSIVRLLSPENHLGCPTGSSPAISGSTVIASFGCYGPEDTGDTVEWTDLTGHLVAFDTQSGSTLWTFTTIGFDPMVSPAISDGIVVTADSANAEYSAGTVYAVDAATGNGLWRFHANTGFGSTPAIEDGMVLVIGFNGELFALDLKTGIERWRFKIGARSYQSPAVSDDVVYIGNDVGTLYAIDVESGTELWHAIPHNTSESSPVLTRDTVFLGGWAGFINRIDRRSGQDAGSRIAAGEPRAAIHSSPAVVGGTIYVTRGDGGIVALGDVRATIPIGENMTVEVTTESLAVRAAPSSGAVVRGEVNRGATLPVTGPSEEREGQTWWPVEAESVGSGWVPESAIVAAEVPPTPSPALTPTRTLGDEDDAVVPEAGATEPLPPTAVPEQPTAMERVETFALEVTDAAPGASGEVIYRQGENLLLLNVRNLPELEPGEVYEVWLIAGDDPPRPAGVFDLSTDQHAIVADRGQFDVLAITNEPGPLGTEAPTGEIVATASL